MHEHTSLQEIILRGEEPTIIREIAERDLSEEERSELGRLADLGGIPDFLVLTPNKRLRVGRTRIRNYVITVPPPMAPEVFVDFVLYGFGLDLQKFVVRRTALVETGRWRKADVFLTLLAHLLVVSAERILRQQVSRQYVAHEDRQLLLRGRPVWGRDFGRHPAEGITCLYRLLDTDNILNRLVLAGLEASASILNGTGSGTRASNQVFIWRALANSVPPKLADFETAVTRLNRLTEHYRPALSLSQAVAFGVTPSDILAGSRTPFQTVEFSLPLLFERFVHRFLEAVAKRYALTVTFREEDRKAIVDGTSTAYRSIEPDFVLFRHNTPVAVIDAKFKPRYVVGLPGTPVPRGDRVTTDDIFQVFFYQARLKARFQLDGPPVGAILAPYFEDRVITFDRQRRTICWRGPETTDTFELRVIPLSIPAVVKDLRNGIDESGILNRLGEFKDLLSTFGAEPAWPALGASMGPRQAAAEADHKT